MNQSIEGEKFKDPSPITSQFSDPIQTLSSQLSKMVYGQNLTDAEFSKSVIEIHQTAEVIFKELEHIKQNLKGTIDQRFSFVPSEIIDPFLQQTHQITDKPDPKNKGWVDNALHWIRTYSSWKSQEATQYIIDKISEKLISSIEGDQKIIHDYKIHTISGAETSNISELEEKIRKGIAGPLIELENLKNEIKSLSIAKFNHQISKIYERREQIVEDALIEIAETIQRATPFAKDIEKYEDIHFIPHNISSMAQELNDIHNRISKNTKDLREAKEHLAALKEDAEELLKGATPDQQSALFQLLGIMTEIEFKIQTLEDQNKR